MHTCTHTARSKTYRESSPEYLRLSILVSCAAKISNLKNFFLFVHFHLHYVISGVSSAVYPGIVCVCVCLCVFVCVFFILYSHTHTLSLSVCLSLSFFSLQRISYPASLSLHTSIYRGIHPFIEASVCNEFLILLLFLYIHPFIEAYIHL
jgi:hypothetical protein